MIGDPCLRMMATNVEHAGCSAFLSENLSKMDRSIYSGRHALIKKLFGERKTYKEVQKMVDRSTKIISKCLKKATKTRKLPFEW